MSFNLKGEIGCNPNCRFCIDAVVGEGTGHGCLPWLVSHQPATIWDAPVKYYDCNLIQLTSQCQSAKVIMENNLCIFVDWRKWVKISHLK